MIIMNIKRLIILILIISIILSSIGCIEEEKFDDRYDIYVGLELNSDFSNIQDAIDNASDGDSIYVYDGDYFESIFINKTITIIAQSNNKTIITLDEKDNQTKSIITINSDNCIIDGIKINNSTNKNLIGILITSSNNTILNNTISNFDKAIFIDSDYNNNYANNTIKFNSLLNNYYGIYMEYTNENNISNNYISLTKEYGLYLLTAHDNLISNNSVINNINYGIRIKGSRNNLVIHNDISENQRGLLFCCGARSNIVYKNNFINNTIYNAEDKLGNIWDNGNIGNYWDDYVEKYPDSEIIDKTWNIPYNVTTGYKNTDNFPLVNPI